MKKAISILIMLFAVSAQAFGWGRTGHQAVAYIAECHLNPQTKAILLDFLDGESIVATSNWPDEIRFIDEYVATNEHTKYGHSAFYTDDNKVIWDSPYPSAVVQISEIQDKYRDGKWRNYPKEEVKRDIMYLTHAIGDMHCPLHVKRTSDPNPTVYFYGKKTKYHTLWDNELITKLNNWSFTEYEYMLGRLSESEIEEVTKGSVKDWGEDIARYTQIVFDWVEPDCEINKVFAYQALPVAHHCIQYAGYRMARYFNEIFK